ncbi:MAG: hypothetical protein GX301_13180 [Gracilibacteraceae bacterium]|nr:hypothetical protein [Gracilibacteraceae bacterium]
MLISIIGILIVLVFSAIMFLSGIKGEFVGYLSERYPDLSFEVGFTKIDPIYEKYYALATCLDDGTSFPIVKSFNSKEIYDDYLQYKSRNQYNSKIQEVFSGSGIESSIRSVTGGGKKPFETGAAYEQINIHLTNDGEHLAVVKEALALLAKNDIAAEKVIFTYEKDKHVYELWVSSEEYALTEEELKEKVRNIK